MSFFICDAKLFLYQSDSSTTLSIKNIPRKKRIKQLILFVLFMFINQCWIPNLQ